MHILLYEVSHLTVQLIDCLKPFCVSLFHVKVKKKKKEIQNLQLVTFHKYNMFSLCAILLTSVKINLLIKDATNTTLNRVTFILEESRAKRR